MGTEMHDMVTYNAEFVAREGYLPYATDARPDKKTLIVTCMDTRLTTLLPAALGLKNGDVKIVKVAGAMVTSASDAVMRSIIVGLYAFDITNVMVIGHDDCGMAKADNSYLLDKMYGRGIAPEMVEEMKTLGFDVSQWLRGFCSAEDAVRDGVALIKAHPLVATDVRVEGFVMNPATGALRGVG